MQKKKPLGMDPLSWLKGEDKEEEPKNDVSAKENVMDNPPEEEVINDPPEPKNDDNELNTRHKIQEEEKVYEPSDVTEKHRKAILGEKAYDYHVKSRETPQKDSPATAFVIVYTILLLILGFIVYRDLTKKSIN